MSIERPLPEPSAISQMFWQKALEGQLWLQYCKECSRFIFYPRVICPHCFSTGLEWKPVSGQGVVYTFTVVYRTDLPGFEEQIPYIYAVVELEEGPRMTTNIINCSIDEVYIGMPVEVVFKELTADISLPCFQPRCK